MVHHHQNPISEGCGPSCLGTPCVPALRPFRAAHLRGLPCASCCGHENGSGWGPHNSNFFIGSFEYLRIIYGISVEFLWNISGISLEYLWNIYGMSMEFGGFQWPWLRNRWIGGTYHFLSLFLDVPTKYAQQGLKFVWVMKFQASVPASLGPMSWTLMISDSFLFWSTYNIG